MNITVRQCMIGETKWFRNLEGNGEGLTPVNMSQ